ncbi:MAG: Chromate transporter, chromate ion transporter family [Actinomycetia bacterium]|nr:Chromate transporter, chromate ion transporter family [Actinomycetes bacterium]
MDIEPSAVPDAAHVPRVGLAVIAAEWTRIGCLGFGGPPAHIALLRRLCVQNRQWLSAEEFEDGIAATNLLPGPASTQLAIFCAWRLRGTVGALVGGLCFIVPGLILILGLSMVFLAGHPPLWVRGTAAGMGAAVAAVAVHAASGLIPASRRRAQRPVRWIAYLLLGGGAATLAGPYLVLVLIACGATEVVLRRPRTGLAHHSMLVVPAVATGGLAALAWVALKVGALSYGGGFVIIPLMQADAVQHYHWMTAAQFLNAVALGQITPGPVVQTVAVVGYAAAGIGGGLLAAAIAFGPSFVFVLAGGPRFDRLRASATVQAFLDGAGPAAIGAIAGSAIPLAMALTHLWQFGILTAAALWLFALRRGVVTALLGAGALGVIAALAGLTTGV